MEPYVNAKLNGIFTDMIVRAVTECQADCNNEKGVYFVESRAKMDAEMKKLTSRGVAPFLSDFTWMKMVFDDQLLFSRDFTLFSLIPLEGFFKWSEAASTLIPGFTVDIAQGKLLNTVTPRLNFESLMKIYRMDAAAAAECEEVKHFEEIIGQHGPVMLDETGEVP